MTLTPEEICRLAFTAFKKELHKNPPTSTDMGYWIQNKSVSLGCSMEEALELTLLAIREIAQEAIQKLQAAEERSKA